MKRVAVLKCDLSNVKKRRMTRACGQDQEIPNETRRGSRGKPKGILG